MAVLKMQRITICALKKNRKAILEKLQSLGVLEVNHILDEDEDFRKMDTAERKTGFEKAAAAVDQALDILEQYAPEKRSMFSALEGKKLISADEEMKVQEERRDLLRTARQIYEAVAADSFDASWTGISSMVYKLRRKLGAGIIETVRGHGYRFTPK